MTTTKQALDSNTANDSNDSSKLNLIRISAKSAMVSEIQSKSFLETCYKAIGTNIVDLVRVNDSIDIWIDDNGRVYPPESNRINHPTFKDTHVYGFLLTTKDGRQLPLAGNVIISGGADDYGNTKGTDLTSDEILLHVMHESDLDSVEKAHNPLGFILVPCLVPLI